MEIPIHTDGNGQPYVEWSQGHGGYKRAWIRRPADPDKDWAGVGRYLNVVRVAPVRQDTGLSGWAQTGSMSVAWSLRGALSARTVTPCPRVCNRALTEAAAWFHKADEEGNARAQATLGSIRVRRWRGSQHGGGVRLLP